MRAFNAGRGFFDILQMRNRNMTTEKTPNKTLSRQDPIVFYRDLVVKMLGWGMAFFLTMSGWLISSSNMFSFRKACHSDVFLRALALTVLASVVLFFWVGLTYTIRTKCPEHSTVPPKWFVLSFCLMIGILSGIEINLVVKD
jgi:hypothetical protein